MKRLLLFVVAIVAMAAPGFSQGKDDSAPRSVQGVVTDANDRPVEGAVVQLKDTKTLQIRSFITKADGTYHFHGLNPNVDYELKAEYQGTFSPTKTLSSFDSKKVAVVNLKLDSKK
jgi:protocatechuate 3,4-dioxygenase beta subunit